VSSIFAFGKRIARREHPWIAMLTLSVFSGCSGSVSSIPDAPPPYPSFPIPQERYNSAQVYGGQNLPTSYTPPYSPPSGSYQQPPAPTFYTPPPSAPPTQPNLSARPSHKYTPPAPNRFSSKPNRSSQSSNYTLKANADLWALVQNAKGVELEWLKMKAGDSTELNYSEDLTITCSSGNQLVIVDNKGKQIDTNPNSSGISIVRLSHNLSR